MAAGKNVRIALALAVLVMANLVIGSWAQNPDCFCQCMHLQCMTLAAATRDVCGEQCDYACRIGGNIGRSNPNDFCGY